MIYGEFEYGSTEYGSYISPGSEILQECSAQFSVSSLISNRPGKNFTNSNTVSADYLKTVSKGLSFSKYLSESNQKNINCISSVTANISESKGMSFGVPFSDILSVSIDYNKRIYKIFSDSIQQSISVYKEVLKIFSFSQQLSESYIKKEEKNIPELLNLSSIYNFGYRKNSSDQINISESYSKISNYIRSLTENESLLESIQKNSSYIKYFSEGTSINIQNKSEIIKYLTEQFYLSIIIYAYFETTVRPLENLSISEQKNIISSFLRSIEFFINSDIQIQNINSYYRRNTESISVSELIDLSKRFGKDENISAAISNIKEIFCNKNIDLNFNILMTTPYFLWFDDNPSLAEDKTIKSEFYRRINYNLDVLSEKTIEYLFPTFSENISSSILYKKEIRKDYENTLNFVLSNIISLYKNIYNEIAITEDVFGGGKRSFYDGFSVSEAHKKLSSLPFSENISPNQDDISYFSIRSITNIEILNFALSLEKELSKIESSEISSSETVQRDISILKNFIESTIVNSLIDLATQRWVGKNIISKTLQGKTLLNISKEKGNLINRKNRIKTLSSIDRGILKTNFNDPTLHNESSKTSIKTKEKTELWSTKV